MKLYREIEKTFPIIEKYLTAESLDEFKNEKIADLCFYNFGLGTWIRNNLLCPGDSLLYDLFLEHDINHPDDMSAFIIRLFHYYKN